MTTCLGNCCSPGCRLWCLWWCLFVLSFFPRGVLDEILNLIESVSEEFPSYSWQVYSYLTLKQVHAKTILTQIWSKSIKRLLRYCHFLCSELSLVTANGNHIGIPNCKKYNGFIQETFWHKVGSISANGTWNIVIFMFVLVLDSQLA